MGSKRAVIALMSGLLGFGLMTGVLAQTVASPASTDADDVECGGGLVAQDSFSWYPSDDAPREPEGALEAYLQGSTGTERSVPDTATNDFRLHEDSERPSTLSEDGSLRYIHPTEAGFDADVQVVEFESRWYVEGARTCQSAIDEWQRWDEK